jgi:hypothetical protein
LTGPLAPAPLVRTATGPSGSQRATAPSTASPASARPAGTPAILRALLVSLTLTALAWGAVGAWTVGQHSSAAAEVVTTSEPLSLDAQQLYQSLSDADVTATTAFLAGPPLPLPVRQRYEADIARAAADLAALRSAGPGTASLTASLQAVSAGLPAYTGYVQQAQTYSALGFPLTGGSFMQVASEEMHLTLLPAARAIYAQENTALAASSGRATGLPWIIVVLGLAAAIAVALVRTQRWLQHRTRRLVNYGLVTATLAVLVAGVWMIAAFLSARSDLERGLGHGSTPAEALAQAGIAAQQARGDEVLNLISRSGSTSFQADFVAMRHRIGPGGSSLLAVASSESPGGPGAAAVTAAGRDATTWYAVAGRVFRLDLASNYAAETQLVIGSGSGSSAAGFTRLEADLRRAIAADQVVFQSGASAGSGAFGGLEAGVILAALVMAAGCAWGLSRRLAEYR